MRHLLLSAAVLIASATGASAADLPSRRAPAPVIAAVPVFTWTGFYIGAQAGYAWGEDEHRLFDGGVDVTPFNPFFASGNTYDVDGVVGGVHAGYNRQLGSIVVGLEGDLEAAGIRGDRLWGVPGNSLSAESEINLQGSVRARLGYALDRTLVYVTGGAAFARFENTYTDVLAGFEPLVDERNASEWGWTIGAGIEHAFTDNLTARVEYRYTRFDSYTNVLDPVPPPITVEQEPDIHAVRVGVSYKFNGY